MEEKTAGSDMPQKTSKRKIKPLYLLVIIPVVLAIIFLGYFLNYYHAEDVAQDYLNSTDSVTVVKLEKSWFFNGPGEGKALVFYGGAKVEEEAYAGLMYRLAEEGMDCFLVMSPFRFAFFAKGEAGRLITDSKFSSYEEWYVGGHSLGGVVAAAYAADNADKVKGVVLLASYSAGKLPEDTMLLQIYGTEDKVLNTEKYKASEKYRPEKGSFEEYVIEGGNHAGFGYYGEQKGDGKASISADKQQELTAAKIAEFIK